MGPPEVQMAPSTDKLPCPPSRPPESPRRPLYATEYPLAMCLEYHRESLRAVALEPLQLRRPLEGLHTAMAFRDRHRNYGPNILLTLQNDMSSIY